MNIENYAGIAMTTRSHQKIKKKKMREGLNTIKKNKYTTK